MSNQTVCKIVLTGGPCGGKSSAIGVIQKHFTAQGYRVLTVSEVATDLIAGGVSPASCACNKDYQQAQVSLQIAKELAYEHVAARMTDERILIVCDRGVMDNRAYMTGDEFSDIVQGLGYSEERLLLGYSAVFHMETAATCGAYTTANNASRTETPEMAIAVDSRIREAWAKHPHFHWIKNEDCASFDEKLELLLHALENHLASRTEMPAERAPSTVFAIGRWMPIHLGHKKFLIELAKKFDRLVVGIGSCYENGTARNCIPAVEREILLRKIFRREGIPDEKVEIIPLADKETFEEWINDVISVCEHYGVTHFCTGNKEDILNVLEKKNIHLNLTMIDPEANSAVEYHATDVRNAILSGDEQAVRQMIPEEIVDMVKSQVAREILAAKMGQGRSFIPGKQTVDVVLLTREKDGDYVLMGNRCAYKRDFAGYPALPGSGILEYESALDAALRVLRLETGIACTPDDRTQLPMPLHIELGLHLPATMHFVNIFSSPDMEVNGTLGGASQCFAIVGEGAKEKLSQCLYSRHDLTELRWVKVAELANMEPAYEQKSMIYEALEMLQIPCPEECFDVLHEDGTPTSKRVTRRTAHRRGVLHGAAHVCIYRRKSGHTEVLLQKRSDDKDSYPGCYDLASAGHMEAHSTFLETAQKELAEELGLTAAENELQELFTLRISDIGRFHGQMFHNEELCRVYAWEKDLDPAALQLQTSELSEVRWFDLSQVASAIAAGDPLFCTDREEFAKIAAALT